MRNDQVKKHAPVSRRTSAGRIDLVAWH